MDMEVLLANLPLALSGLGGCVLLLAYTLWRKQRAQQHGQRKIDEKHNTETIPFRTPNPRPLKDFKVELTDPELYRPFRHGKNNITMGIRKMSWNEWIQMDSNYIRYHDRKVSELENDIDAHVAYVDNAVTRDGCFEMYEELTKFLTHRYPDIYKLEANILSNSLTGEKFQYPASTPAEALTTSSKLVQDDLVLMVMNDDGHYHLDAAAVCLPGFWRVHEKFRMSLDTLHIEAGVPHYQEKLMKSMNKFFLRMKPEDPIIRNNFFIQLDDGLHWSHRMGDQNATTVASWATADGTNLKIEDIHFRSERQSLRRLPRSGVLMFTIRTYFEPITRIAQEPHVPGRLAEAIRAWDDTVSYYKGRKMWEGILLPYLDEMHQKQVESGVLEENPEAEFPF